MRISKRARTARGRAAIVVVLAALIGSMFSAGSAQADIYYTTGSSIKDVGRSGYDTLNPPPSVAISGLATLPFSSGMFGIATVKNHIFYVRGNLASGAIGRSTLNPDGSVIPPVDGDAQTAEQNFIPSLPGNPFGIGLAPDGSALYWTQLNGGTVGRAPLDANGDLAGPVNPTFISGLPTQTRHVVSDGKYIYVSTQNRIVRSLPTGGPFENFITGLSSPDGMAVTDNALYYASGTTIGRLKLDPVTREPVGQPATFVSGLAGPNGLSFDGRYLWILDDNGVNATNVRKIEIAPNGDAVGSVSGTIFVATTNIAEGIFATHDTTASLTCDPSPIVLGSSTTCTANVMDADPGSAVAAKGTVDISNVGSGELSAESCTLAPTATPGLAQCSVTYTPTEESSDTLSVEFDGGVGFNKASPTVTDIDSFLRHSSDTSSSCTPAQLTIEHTVECTATVTDTATSGALGIQPPLGTVTFDPSASGDFDPSPQCDLVPIVADPDSSSCSVTFESTQIGGQDVEANYAGQPEHFGSDGTSNAFTILGRTTNVAISCSPVVVTAGTPSVCEASVADTDIEAPHLPEGTVNFSSSGGTFSPSSCTLAPSGGGESGCSGVTFTPTTAGMQTVTASYAGDQFHAGDSGQREVSVKEGPKSTGPAGNTQPPANPKHKSGKGCGKKKSKKAREKCRKKKKKH